MKVQATWSKHRRGTYGEERLVAYNSLRAADVSSADAKAMVRRADRYFMDYLGFTYSSPTGIPGRP